MKIRTTVITAVVGLSLLALTGQATAQPIPGRVYVPDAEVLQRQAERVRAYQEWQAQVLRDAAARREALERERAARNTPKPQVPDWVPGNTSPTREVLDGGRCRGPRGEGWCSMGEWEFASDARRKEMVIEQAAAKAKRDAVEAAAQIAAEQKRAEKAADAARRAAEIARLDAIEAARPHLITGTGRSGYLRVPVVWRSSYAMEAGLALFKASADEDLVSQYVACVAPGVRVAVTYVAYNASYYTVTVLEGKHKGCTGAVDSVWDKMWEN